MADDPKKETQQEDVSEKALKNRKSKATDLATLKAQLAISPEVAKAAKRATDVLDANLQHHSAARASLDAVTRYAIQAKKEAEFLRFAQGSAAELAKFSAVDAFQKRYVEMARELTTPFAKYEIDPFFEHIQQSERLARATLGPLYDLQKSGSCPDEWCRSCG